MEVPSGRAVLSDLCMPYSPRALMASSVCGFWNRTVLRVDPRQDMMETLAELPGFTRQRQP